MSKDKQRMGNNNIKFGALLIVALFIGSAATFAVSMADAATSSEYIVGKDFRGKTFVKNDRGRIVQSSYDSARMIQYAIDRAPQGTSIKIDKGEYTLRNSINSKTGVTISGAGNETVLKNGQILIQTSNVIITSLRMEGTCHLVIMPDRVPIQNIIVRNISATLGKVESAFSVITNKYDVSDITFSHNIVLNSGSSGFLLSGNAQITDISIESCNVVNSGINSRYNDWVSGFILAQHAPVKNMLVANCEASNNWENGFFLKPEMKKDNVILKDCIANNNGRKAKFSEGYGYYLDESVAMIRCIGEGNGGGLSNLAQLPDPEPAPERIPEISKIILEIDDMKANVGSTLKITGTLMGTTGVSGAKVMVKIVDPNGVSINPIRGGTVTTDNEGKFAVNYKPPMVGAYIFVATFSGSEDYSKSDASMLFNAVAIVPEPEPVLKGSKITLTQSDMSVEIGETFTISGILSDGIGIARATVSIKIVYSDGTTTHSFGEDKVITDRYGRFSMTYMPDRIGDYMITATFVGDNSHTASSASLSFGAIDLLPDDPVLDTVTYDYVVSNNVVRSSSGTIVYTGNSFTTALQWAVKQTGKIIYVLSGTYYVTGTLSMASGSTLIGDGEAETVFHFTNSSPGNSRIDLYNVNDVTLKSFSFTGNGAVRIVAEHAIVGGHLIQDVTAFETSNIHEAAFQSLTLAGGSGTAIMDGLTFIRVKALYTGGIGFQLHGDGWRAPGGAWQMKNYNIWTKNVYMEDIVADHCGINSRYNDWVVGIDLAELTNVENIKVVRGIATNNWEAGFHFEPMPIVRNVILQDCISNNNGQKPSTYYNKETNNYGPHFGVGYFLGRSADSSQYQMINCSGADNSKGLILRYVGPTY